MSQTSELFPSPQGSKTNLSQHLGVLQGREKIALYSFSLPFLITTGTWHCSRKTTWEVLWEEAGVTGHGRTFPYTALVRYRVKKKTLPPQGGDGPSAAGRATTAPHPTWAQTPNSSWVASHVAKPCGSSLGQAQSMMPEQVRGPAPAEAARQAGEQLRSQLRVLPRADSELSFGAQGTGQLSGAEGRQET